MLIGPNWGQWYDAMQSSTRILHIWDAMRGNLITTTTPHTRDLLVKLSPPPAATATAAQQTAYEAAKDVWDKKNAQGLDINGERNELKTQCKGRLRIPKTGANCL